MESMGQWVFPMGFPMVAFSITSEVGDFYRLRYLCYIQQAVEDFSSGQQVNKTRRPSS